MVRRTSTAIEAFPQGMASAHGGMRLNQLQHAQRALHQTHERAAVTTFRARGSLLIVSENENYEKMIDNEGILHAETASAVILRGDEVYRPCEGGQLIAPTGNLREAQAKNIGQCLEDQQQEQEDGRGDHQMAGRLLRTHAIQPRSAFCRKAMPSRPRTSGDSGNGRQKCASGDRVP